MFFIILLGITGSLLARITRSSVLKVTGIPDETPIDKIKEFFGKYGDVAWVDFGKGDDHVSVHGRVIWLCYGVSFTP